MNIVFIKHYFVGFIVSEIPRVSVFGYFPLYAMMGTILFYGSAIQIQDRRSIYAILPITDIITVVNIMYGIGPILLDNVISLTILV